MEEFVTSVWYRLFIFAIVMPINGYLVSNNPMLIILIIMQLPWAYKWASKGGE